MAFEEKFRSPFKKETREDALEVLEEIRRNHPADKGWEEIDGFVEQLPDGKWRAVRHHKKTST